MNRAFSLIELLIVIAIVGILSGTAVALYKSYLDRSKAQSTMTFLNFIADKSINYYNMHGTFGNAETAGLPVLNGNPLNARNIDDSDFIGPGTQQILFSNYSVAGQCNYGQMSAGVSFVDEDNYDPDNTQGAGVYLTYIDIHGTIIKRCYYQQLNIENGTPSIVTGGNTIPNCSEDAAYQTETTNMINTACD